MKPGDPVRADPVRLSSFHAPGQGEWHIVDHIVHPGSQCFSDYYYHSMQDGWNSEARRIGIINRVQIREVNGFMYYRMYLISKRNAEKTSKKMIGYWDEKRFYRQLTRWDTVVKPRSITKLLSLQETPLEKLTNDELLKHIEKCIKVTKLMVRNHHQFTYTSFIPIGDFVRQVSNWTSLKPADILESIKGENDQLSVIVQHSMIKELIDGLRGNTRALYLLSQSEQYPDKAGAILEQLMLEKDPIGIGMQFYLKMLGYRVVDGYDINSETYNERPDLILKSLKALSTGTALREPDPTINLIHELLPAEYHNQFEEIQSVARTFQRLRNERGFYTDLWAIGILRLSYLEAGRRLQKMQQIPSADLVLGASYQELVDLFLSRGKISLTELEQRAQYRSRFSVEDAPASIGIPETQSLELIKINPDLERTMLGLFTAIELAVDHPVSDDKKVSEPQCLTGIAASKGIVEGLVRVIESTSQLQQIQKNDILVVYQGTAALNAVFPIIGGIISQFGGTLSHPAILAREQSIPCVVGCKGAVNILKTGMRIRLNGTTGTVHILSADEDIFPHLERLQCSYTGPMQGRNRDRVLNHINSVGERQRIIEIIRSDQRYIDLLERHFNNEVSSEETITGLATLAQQVNPASIIGMEEIYKFSHRDHIEFHPCDACNLSCDGCTYFQDEELKPGPTSFPYDTIKQLGAVFQPKAITLVGGGEPTLYFSNGKRFADLIMDLGTGKFGFTPAIGVITNGTVWPKGESDWHRYVNWIRFSLDAATPSTYRRMKGVERFDQVAENVMRALLETNIPQVGVGFIYHPGNINEAGSVIALFANMINKRCPDKLERFNIQFRPWRNPTGRPSIKDHIISISDAENSARNLFREISQNSVSDYFVQRHTNLAVNLLCRGARETAEDFSECFFGLAKNVVRADGSVYPCFRMAAERNSSFYIGNIISDSVEKIVLRSIYINAVNAKNICVTEPDKCLFCIFNNQLEKNLSQKPQLSPDIMGDYFF